ncbi:M28 family peptidase [Clostridium oryzae]|uniref:Aminopeptidase YwaD n=1 Tax=Clostridium oryzae TaxID=1450648 RepID=A0A1V4IIF8_9CLOT|nr:M28 family peptidase [Clostridium oryzae]OPJ59716.1 aminopeptidase YwaD precursor [Clostridium oryzae]
MDERFHRICDYIDIANSEKIINMLSSFGDDKATGNRSAGSNASTRASRYLATQFRNIGLRNVTIDSFNRSGWTYKGANIIYRDENGNSKKIVLGGYACSIEADSIDVKVVDGGKGKIDDYKSLGDVTDKLILISIEMWKDFWVSYPAYQAYLKGAKAILVYTKYEVLHEDNLVSQSIGGSAHAPALAITKRDYDILRNLIKKSDSGDITVKLTAHSYVYTHKTSYNIWGEIPGKTDEVIYLIAHYDGYYHSYFDDASGVSTIIGIAKAIIDSGYKPYRTIRIVTHGAEEWGVENSDFDWSVGAYEQITHIHPEWAEKAFALINIDGSFAVPHERNYHIIVSSELKEYVKKSAKPIIRNSGYNYKIETNNSVMSEEFAYAKAGIPCITPRESFYTGIYYTNIYHSSMDSKAFGFDKRTYRLTHILYGKILFDLDNTPVRPMDFYQRFVEIKESINTSITGRLLLSTARRASIYAHELSSKIKQLNMEDTNQMLYEKSKYKRLNIELFGLYKIIQNSFVRLNWRLDVEFPHQNYQMNIALLSKAIKALKNESESLENVVNNYIKPIDMNEYVYDIDKNAYNYFANRAVFENKDTWGYRMISKPNEDLYEVAQSLKAKFNKQNPNVEQEIKVLQEALNRQSLYLKEAVNREIADIYKIIEKMKRIICVINKF